MVIEKVKFL